MSAERQTFDGLHNCQVEEVRPDLRFGRCDIGFSLGGADFVLVPIGKVIGVEVAVISRPAVRDGIDSGVTLVSHNLPENDRFKKRRDHPQGLPNSSPT